ncbi:BBSome interacting protein 1 [Tachypleus tridentatus]|uniref:BBSome interacting protein 1 n=1 Tax=Tachypleus tridentatus TaxID=6853 RepID=UPI003FD2075C
MPESQTAELKEVIPNKGMLFQEETSTYVLCKPKLMPLKSVTLEKLEKMQKEAEEKVKKQMDNSHLETK